jgi:hypothetical protein
MLFEAITIVLTLAGISVLLWAVWKFLPGPTWIKYLINIITAVIVLFWLLSLIGYHYPGTHG